MTDADLNNRILLDVHGSTLKPGDIVYCYNYLMATGVFVRTFDKGSGWKATIRIPSKGVSPNNKYVDSTVKNIFISHSSRIKSLEKKNEEVRVKSLAIVKINEELDNQEYRDAKILREYLVRRGEISIKPHKEACDTTDEIIANSQVDILNIVSSLGRPEIKSLES